MRIRGFGRVSKLLAVAKLVGRIKRASNKLPAELLASLHMLLLLLSIQPAEQARTIWICLFLQHSLVQPNQVSQLPEPASTPTRRTSLWLTASPERASKSSPPA